MWCVYFVLCILCGVYIMRCEYFTVYIFHGVNIYSVYFCYSVYILQCLYFTVRIFHSVHIS